MSTISAFGLSSNKWWCWE